MDANMRTILVTGATGKQGGGTIKALLRDEKPSFRILAVSRKPTSSRAQALQAMPNVSVIEGDLDDCEAIFRKAGKVWGVFSVQLPNNTDHAAEGRQGKALFDAAAAHGVEHFIYASVDRGGPERSDRDATPVPHFETKYTIEKYIEERAPRNNMIWTFLRPAAFFENLTPDFLGKVFATTWKTSVAAPIIVGVEESQADFRVDSMPAKCRLQMISTEDIGIIATLAFKNARDPRFHNAAISIASDELTFREAAQLFEQTQGRAMPTTFTFVARFFRFAIPAVGKMFSWFEEVGYGANISELRSDYPELQDFSTWLRTRSGFQPVKRSL